MITELDGKVAVVTGGATLIGTSIALLLAARGASVMLADTVPDQPEALTSPASGDIAYQSADITSDAEIGALLANTADRFGGLDIIVNVAVSYAEDGLETDRAT